MAKPQSSTSRTQSAPAPKSKGGALPKTFGRKGTNHFKGGIAEGRAHERERAAASAAVERMQAARPLSPPRRADGTVIRPVIAAPSAAALALAEDRRKGLVE